MACLLTHDPAYVWIQMMRTGRHSPVASVQTLHNVAAAASVGVHPRVITRLALSVGIVGAGCSVNEVPVYRTLGNPLAPERDRAGGRVLQYALFDELELASFPAYFARILRRGCW